MRAGAIALVAMLLAGAITIATPAPAAPPSDGTENQSDAAFSARTLSLCGLVYAFVQPRSPTSNALVTNLPVTVYAKEPLRNFPRQQIGVFTASSRELVDGMASSVLFPADTSGRGPGLIIDLEWTGGSTSIATEAYVDNCYGSFEPSTPTRVLDTRTGVGRNDWVSPVPAFGVVEIDVSNAISRATDGVTSVALNVTVTNPEVGGFVAVYSCGQTLPTASNLNFAARETTPNLVMVDLVGRSPVAKVCIFTSATTDLIADVTGAFINYHPPWTQTSAGPLYTPMTQPSRVLDTRAGVAVAANTHVRVRVGDHAGIPSAGLRAASMNITAASPEATGFLTVYPCDAPVPNASTVNFVAGQDRPNAAVIAVSANAEVCVFASAKTHVIVDVNGYFTAGGSGVSYWPHGPLRRWDSRSSVRAGEPGPSPLSGGTTFAYTLSAYRPGDVVSLNVTATEAVADGYASVYPCSRGAPETSNLNFARNQSIANAVIVKLDENKTFCVYASATVHFIIDQAGTFFAPRT